MDLDDVLKEIGECGKYQHLLLWFVLLPATMPCAFHAYTQVFLSAKPQHWCSVPSLGERGLPMDAIKNLSVPRKEGGYSQCTMYSRNGSGGFDRELIVPCQNGWNYDLTKYKSTVVTEWDLVCDKDFSAAFALVLYAVGGLIGNYIFGYVQDLMGRRPAFFIYLAIQSVFTIASAFANNFILWVILRVGVGFTVPAILGTPMVLSLELVGPKKRTMVFILINIFFSIGLVLLSGVVYYFRSWRQLTLASCAPFLIFFAYWWVLPESPRWLLSQGKYKKTEQVLQKIAAINGKELPENCINRLKARAKLDRKNDEKARRRYGVWDLFRYPNLRRNTIIVTFIWFATTAVYVGLSYYAPSLGGDEFLNFFLAGVVELPTYFILWPAMEHIGRRYVLSVSMVIGGTACLATYCAQNNHIATLVLYCIGKMGISSSFVVVPLVASELYPTVVRGLGMSTSSVVAQIGPILIPFINYLGERWRILPLMIMGALLVVGGGIALLLPETLNQHLPQTLEDGETLPKRDGMTDISLDEPEHDNNGNLTTSNDLNAIDSI